MKSNSSINTVKFLRLKDAIFPKNFWLSDFMLIGYFATISLVLHLLAIRGFGYFRDEFYYIACSEHLDFGYVDQPPLAMLLLKLIRLAFGDSLLAIRILPALCGAAFVFLTGIIARELGGKKFSLILASAAALAPIGNFFIFHMYSMNFLDVIFWQAVILTVIRIIKSENPRYWLVFGLIAGFGLQNKISVLFLCFGILLGVLLTRQRKHLKSKYLWLGLALAAFLFLPYILWNMAHGWPTLEFMQNARTYKMAEVTPLGFLKGQILYNNPAALIIWLVGLWFFFFHKEGKKYRVFGWMYLSIYILFTIQQAKDYYLAPAYPILFAGGAVQFENWLKKKSWRWLKSTLISLILIPTLFFCPFTLPILPVEKTISLIQWSGITGNAGERHELGALPQHFADMFGWEEMVATVAGVYQRLSPEEQSKCIIYVRNYGQAGAIDLFGKKYNLPKATCAHNNYWLWGPPKDKTGEVVIVFGTSSDLQRSYEDLRPHFEEVEHAATIQCKYCMPYENNRPIFICRKMKRSIQEIWEQERFYI